MSNDDLPTLNPLSLEYLEALQREYANREKELDGEWREVLDGDEGRGRRFPSFRPQSIFAARSDGRRSSPVSAEAQNRVDRLIHAYRVRGHRIAELDTLGEARSAPPELDLQTYGLSDSDLERQFACDELFEEKTKPLKDILGRLRETYCHHLGVEFMHMDDLNARRWLQRRMERSANRVELSREQQVRVLTQLTDAAIFEEFLQKRFVGAKVFSLEGAESLIPLLASAIDTAAEQGIDEIVFAMAHRGRLNVLANILGKSPRDIFWEFEDGGKHQLRGRGDVKYHLGYSSDWVTPQGEEVHLSLCFNPSHLEFVNPVAAGRVRAKQDRAGDYARCRKMAILMHGDAALAGEGIVQETLNLSRLAGYQIGGTLHIVVNNQIGFTTSPNEGRSTTYATDVAKMLKIPIFHVNGENPEAVARALELAMAFRDEFRQDVFIDMYCYRRHGHNESDEPSFTQPRMYEAIRKRPSVQRRYLENLLKLGQVTEEEADAIARQRREHLEQELSLTRSTEYQPLQPAPVGVWKDYRGGKYDAIPPPVTSVDQETIDRLLTRLSQVPDDLNLHRTIMLGLARRAKMATGEVPIDWSTAEALALGSLAAEGIPIRLTGQDTARGTFSQRHAILHDTKTAMTYTPLAHVADGQAPVEIVNSPLSEQGALGFEYGYSLDQPGGLVLWEAQFGDFINAAQVIIDQFLVSAEDKWGRLSGLVLLLPHGFEGMGPEHSSARLERFLTLAAEDNIQVAVPSTPAQYFHLLRRQALWRWRKPLIVLTPKSLLRHKVAVSSVSELADGSFRPLLPESVLKEGPAPRRLLLCMGKVYYDLLAYREKEKIDDVAIVRLEQLYPLDQRSLLTAMEIYPETVPVVWVQEEPWNMGAWPYLRLHFGDRFLGRFSLSAVTRPESASPATGSPGSHQMEQEALVEAALRDE